MWARLLVRPATVPDGLPVICVGGATFGGSGKTPLAIACARMLDARVVLIGHAYRASPGYARIVDEDSPLGAVGDEAIVCARALRGTRARVVVAPTRQEAIDFAVSLAPEALVLDGPLRLSHARRQTSLLAVDPHEPWGTGWNLRAPRRALLAIADAVVPVEGDISVKGEIPPHVGLFTALARPERIIRAVGIPFVDVISTRDHGPLGPRVRRRIQTSPARAFLATEKCALHMVDAGLSPAGVIRFELHARTRPALTRLFLQQ